MVETPSPDAVKPVVLVFADVSGYTRFTTQHDAKALRHGRMIIGDLLETLLRQVDVPLSLSSVEGRLVPTACACVTPVPTPGTSDSRSSSITGRRVLRPGGRVQIADITVERPIPDEAKGDIDLWTN